MNVADILLRLAPSIIQGLTSRGVDKDHAAAAVHGAINDAATAHDKEQDARLDKLESTVNDLARILNGIAAKLGQ